MFKCYFRIEPEEARQIDDDEEEIADFFLAAGLIGLEEGYPKLGSFFTQLGEDAFHGFPVKAYLGGSAGQLVGFEECGEATRDALKGGRKESHCWGRVTLFFGL